MRSQFARPGLVAAAALFFAVTGCGRGSGTLTGKVTYQDQPVIYGTVMVRAADGTQWPGAIEPDGTYTVLNVPAGPVTIAIDSPQPQDPSAHKRSCREGGQPPPSAPAIDRSKWVKLPEKYLDPEKSGIATTVTSGTTTFDIELK
jgi:hypothetical protein